MIAVKGKAGFDPRAGQEVNLSRYYSPVTFLGFSLAVTGFTLLIIVKAVLSNHPANLNHVSPWISIACWIIGIVFMWAICVLKKGPGNGNGNDANSLRETFAWTIPLMQDSYHMLLVFALVLRVISEVAAGQCVGGDLDEYADTFNACNVFQDSTIVQPKYMITLMVLPLISYCLIQETQHWTIGASWLMVVGTLLGCGIYMKSVFLLTPVVIYALASMLIFYDTNRQNHEMAQLIEALKETLLENERLQEDTRASELRAMIGNVAHDLKTPMTSILSGIELTQEIIAGWEGMVQVSELAGHPFLVRTQENTLAIKACLNSMLGANAFMTMTINRCLDYTKASKGVKLVPKSETVMLAEALDFPIKLVRDIQHQIEIKYYPIANNICTHIMTDKQWLVENLLCLLSNAVKYSNGGVVEVRVFHTPSNSDQPSMLQFQVEDTGADLSEEAMRTLFAPFKQAQRLAGGTGLGLFCLAKRVEALQGHYGVSKRPDGAQGSLFWFSIPYRPDHVYAHSSPVNSITFKPSDSFQVSAPVPETLKVLVVDDAPTVLKMTSMLLTKKGHHVHQAVHGADALKMLLRIYDERIGSFDTRDTEDTEVPTGPLFPSGQLYDVVLMDLQMPVMDGIEAIRRLRAAESQLSKKTLSRRPPFPVNNDIESADMMCSSRTEKSSEYGILPAALAPCHCFVIALSANSDSETAAQAMMAGADAFIGKPFTYDTFMQVMSRRPGKMW